MKLQKNIRITKKDNVGCHPTLSDFEPTFKKTKRGYEVILFEGSYKSSKHNHSVNSKIVDFERKGRGGKNIYLLIKVDMKRWSNGARFTNGYYTGYWLIGHDDGSDFVTRLPNKDFKTIDEALEYMKPAVVKKAEKEGKKVFRQGDVFFIEASKRTNIFKQHLPASHKIGEDLVVRHGEHSALKLPHPHFKVALRKALSDND